MFVLNINETKLENRNFPLILSPSLILTKVLMEKEQTKVYGWEKIGELEFSSHFVSFFPFVSFSNFDKRLDGKGTNKFLCLRQNCRLEFSSYFVSFSLFISFSNFDKSLDGKETNKDLWPRGDKLSRGQKKSNYWTSKIHLKNFVIT